MKTAAALLSLTSLSLLLAACGGSSTRATEPGNATTAVSISFAAVAGNTPVACNATLTGLGSGQASATVQDFRYYIHDIRLIKANGSKTPLTLTQNDRQYQNVAIIDHTGGKCADNPAATLGSTVTGTIPNDGSHYTGLEFTVGVPESLNHINAAQAASPLNITALWWSWQSGYKHATLEVKPDGGITRPTDVAWGNKPTFMLHLGSTGCSNDQATSTGHCDKSNRPVITLNGYTLNSSKVQLDYAELVAGINLNEDEGGAAGCMSGVTDPECGNIFQHLGLDLASGDAGTTTQTAFSLR